MIDGGTGLDPMKEAKGPLIGMAQRIVQACNTNGIEPVSVGNLIVERRDRRVVSVGIATERQFRLIRISCRDLVGLDPFTEQHIEGDPLFQRHVGDAPPCQGTALSRIAQFAGFGRIFESFAKVIGGALAMVVLACCRLVKTPYPGVH